MIRVKIHAVWLLCLFPSITFAMPLSKYLKSKKTPITETYVIGVAQGLSWANAAILAGGGKPLFCEPSSLRLNGLNYISILDDEIGYVTDKAIKEDIDIESILLHGMQKVFSCDQTSKKQ